MGGSKERFKGKEPGESPKPVAGEGRMSTEKREGDKKPQPRRILKKGHERGTFISSVKPGCPIVRGDGRGEGGIHWGKGKGRMISLQIRKKHSTYLSSGSRPAKKRGGRPNLKKRKHDRGISEKGWEFLMRRGSFLSRASS